MNDHKIATWYYTHFFCRRFNGSFNAFVYSNVRNVSAKFLKSSLYIPHNINTCERSIRYTTSFKISFLFLLDDLPLIKCAQLETISAEQPPPLPRKKSKAKQSRSFLTVFQDNASLLTNFKADNNLWL